MGWVSRASSPFGDFMRNHQTPAEIHDTLDRVPRGAEVSLLYRGERRTYRVICLSPRYGDAKLAQRVYPLSETSHA